MTSFRLLKWEVSKEENGIRLDHFLRDNVKDLTRSRIKKLIDEKMACVDEIIARPATKLKTGNKILFKIPPPSPLDAVAQDIPLDICYEDDYLIVVNKPSDLVVHPSAGHSDGTLVNGLLYHTQTAGGDPGRPGIVHRLDKDTSGLMVVAKDEQVHEHLSQQFQDHSIDRSYLAIVCGTPPDKGRIKTLHGRHPVDRKKFSSKVTRGKTAISEYKKEKQFKGAALIKVTLHTGRTHQVRVHLSDLGFPLLGDKIYSPSRLSPQLKAIHKNLPGQALHAYLLGFLHPHLKKRMKFTKEPPQAFLSALTELEL